MRRLESLLKGPAAICERHTSFLSCIYTMSSSDSKGMLMFSSDSSDEEDELLLLVAIEEEQAASQGRSHQRGSIPSHAVIDRGYREGAVRLFRDYFANNPVYGDTLFRCR